MPDEGDDAAITRSLDDAFDRGELDAFFRSVTWIGPDPTERDTIMGKTSLDPRNSAVEVRCGGGSGHIEFHSGHLLVWTGSAE